MLIDTTHFCYRFSFLFFCLFHVCIFFRYPIFSDLYFFDFSLFFCLIFLCSGDADVAKGRGLDGTVGHDLQVMCPSCDLTVDMFVDTQTIIIPSHPAMRLPWLSKASLSPVTFPTGLVDTVTGLGHGYRNSHLYQYLWYPYPFTWWVYATHVKG